MNDRELAKAMRLIAECERRSGSAQPKTVEMLEQGAARLDALRWRSVEDGLPESGRYIVTLTGDAMRVSIAPLRRGVTHWRYVDPPGAEGGGA